MNMHPLAAMTNALHRSSLLASDAERHADLAGSYAWRWVDGDEWEPVDGTHASAEAATVALAARGIDVADIIVEAVDW
ncbi:MAG: hypothetical protein ACO3UW_10830 [Candidatus Nanopelagicales bacterium]